MLERERGPLLHQPINAFASYIIMRDLCGYYQCFDETQYQVIFIFIHNF